MSDDGFLGLKARLRLVYKLASKALAEIAERSSPVTVAICVCIGLQCMAALLDSVIYSAIENAMLRNGFKPLGLGPQSAATGSAGVLIGQVSTAFFLLPVFVGVARKNARILSILGICVAGLCVIWIAPIVGSIVGIDLSLAAFLLSTLAWLIALAWVFLDVLCRISIIDELLGPDDKRTHHAIETNKEGSSRRASGKRHRRDSAGGATIEMEGDSLQGSNRPSNLSEHTDS